MSNSARCTRIAAGLVTLALAFALTSPVRAHPLSPTLLRLTCDHGTCDALFRSQNDPPHLRLPSDCRVEVVSSTLIEGTLERHERWHCTPADTSFALADAANAPPLLVSFRATPTSDATLTLLDAAHPDHPLQLVTPDAFALFGQWVVLGMEHLALGPDHVLVVLAFVLLIGLRKRLVITLTAFTLGHSVSLALAATGVLTLPSRLVETAIALSIVALALDLAVRPSSITLAAPEPPPPPTPSTPTSTTTPSPAASSPAAPSSPSRGWGPLLAALIGLIHGLGFAGALSEIGLPRAHLAEALIGFNLGLELAQLALVALLAGLAQAARVLPTASRPRALVLLAWVIGVIGATWTLERAFL